MIFKVEGINHLKGPKELYEKRKNYYGQRLERLTQTINRLSNVRLVAFLVGCGLAVFLYMTQRSSWGLGMVITTVVSFLALVLWHQNVRMRKDYIQALYEIHDEALKRLAGEWKSFSDSGEDFKDPAHPYSDDLDLFGTGSLFQKITIAKTFRGREKLKEALSEPAVEAETIQKKQEAIKELARNLAWRQRFMAEARLTKRTMASPKPIIEWAKTYDPSYLRFGIKIIARALPIITITFLLLYLLSSRVSFWFPLTGLVIQTIILFVGKERGKALNAVYPYKESIKVYEKMLERFEKRTFQSDYLKVLKKGSGQSPLSYTVCSYAIQYIHTYLRADHAKGCRLHQSEHHRAG